MDKYFNTEAFARALTQVLASEDGSAALRDAHDEINAYEMDADGFDGSTVMGANTFSDAGLMTSDDGVVVRMLDGSEYQLTIVRSK